MARRPGLALALCTWVAFAAPVAVALERAVTIDGSLSRRIFAVSIGAGDFPSFCLVVAAVLVLIEQLSSAAGEPGVHIVAGTVRASAVVAVAITVAGIVVLPVWSTPTAASDVVAGTSPYLTAVILAALAAVLADLAMRGCRRSEDAK